MRPLKITILLFSLGLGSCVSVSSETARPVVQFQCRQTQMFENGEAWVTAWVTPDLETTSEVVLWIPKVNEDRRIYVIGRWEVRPPADIAWDRGLAMFDRRFDWMTGPDRRRPGKLTLELRANPEGPWEGYGALRGDMRLQAGVRLSADWADVSAMAQGAGTLYLIARERGQVIDTIPLAPSNFAPPEDRIRAMQAEIRSAARSPNEKCEDLTTSDIII